MIDIGVMVPRNKLIVKHLSQDYEVVILSAALPYGQTRRDANRVSKRKRLAITVARLRRSGSGKNAGGVVGNRAKGRSSFLAG